MENTTIVKMMSLLQKKSRIVVWTKVVGSEKPRGGLPEGTIAKVIFKLAMEDTID